MAVISKIKSLFIQVHQDEAGQDTLEWTMLGGLIALAIVGIVGLFTGALTDFATNAADCIDFDSATVCVAGL
jgi:Flp pilus assembly pilin Flp